MLVRILTNTACCARNAGVQGVVVGQDAFEHPFLVSLCSWVRQALCLCIAWLEVCGGRNKVDDAQVMELAH